MGPFHFIIFFVFFLLNDELLTDVTLSRKVMVLVMTSILMHMMAAGSSPGIVH